MADLLRQLNEETPTRRVAQWAGVPVPPLLDRETIAPPRKEPLKDQMVALHTSRDSGLASTLVDIAGNAGATIHISGKDVVLSPTGPHAHHLAQAPTFTAEGPSVDIRYQVLLIDGDSLRTYDSLEALRAFIQPRTRYMKQSGRVVIVARPPEEAESAETRSVRRGLEGLNRSLAKELGKQGVSSNLVYVAANAFDYLEWPLRFLMSNRSSYVTAQTLRVTHPDLVIDRPDQCGPGAMAGRRYVVTGAARGIGRATAEVLAADGADVLCVDRAESSADLDSLIRKIGGKSLTLDITSPAAPETLLKEAGKSGYDSIIHNAGITRDKMMRNMGQDKWNMVMDVNLAAIERMNRVLVPEALRDGGRLVFLSSISGIAGNPGQTNYALTKAGVIGFVDYYAEALKDRGITANAIAPGFIETPMTAKIPVAIREVARRLNAFNQGGLPEDIAYAIHALCAPGASGLNGQVLRVCGGALVGA